LPGLVKNAIRRAIISLLSTDDSKDIRVQQIAYNGKALDVEVYAPYGISYNVPVGSLGILLQIGDDPANKIFLPDRSQDRVKGLEESEIAIFNPITKSRVVFKKNGDIDIDTAGSVGDFNITVKGNCNLTASTTNLTGDLNVDGNLSVTGDADVDGDLDATNVDATGDVKAGSISLKTHLHGGSLTAPTGGVVPTGAPI